VPTTEAACREILREPLVDQAVEFLEPIPDPTLLGHRSSRSMYNYNYM
jgi:hypothetical protein